MSNSFLGMSDIFWYRAVVGLEVLYIIYLLYIKHRLHKIITLSFLSFKKCMGIRQSNNVNDTEAWKEYDKLIEAIINEDQKVTKIENKFR